MSRPLLILLSVFLSCGVLFGQDQLKIRKYLDPRLSGQWGNQNDSFVLVKGERRRFYNIFGDSSTLIQDSSGFSIRDEVGVNKHWNGLDKDGRFFFKSVMQDSTRRPPIYAPVVFDRIFGAKLPGTLAQLVDVPITGGAYTTKKFNNQIWKYWDDGMGYMCYSYSGIAVDSLYADSWTEVYFEGDRMVKDYSNNGIHTFRFWYDLRGRIKKIEMEFDDGDEVFRGQWSLRHLPFSNKVRIKTNVYPAYELYADGMSFYLELPDTVSVKSLLFMEEGIFGDLPVPFTSNFRLWMLLYD